MIHLTLIKIFMYVFSDISHLFSDISHVLSLIYLIKNIIIYNGKFDIITFFQNSFYDFEKSFPTYDHMTYFLIYLQNTSHI